MPWVFHRGFSWGWRIPVPGRLLCGLAPTHSPVSLPQASSEKPKRPISAMFIFSEEKRKQLQEERPELSESELTRLLARMWNDLSEKKKVGTVPDPAPPSPLLCWASPAALVLLRGALLARGDDCPTAPASHHPGAGVGTDGRCRPCPLPLGTWWVKSQQLRKPWRTFEPQLKGLMVFLVGGESRDGGVRGGGLPVLLWGRRWGKLQCPAACPPGAWWDLCRGGPCCPFTPAVHPPRRPSTKRGRRR